jgi:Zn-finger nucleic acid-binding protein
MQCPVDGNTLLIAERHDVEIDYCPNCRGVWLDRGELDKLLRRADDIDDDDDGRWRQRGSELQPPKKKKRWLSEMFEFGE